MLIEVIHAQWGMDEAVFDGGRNEIPVTPENAALLAGAAAADVIRVVNATSKEQALLDGHVQSQEAGVTEYEQAVSEGRWAEGQDVQATAEETDRAAVPEAKEEA